MANKPIVTIDGPAGGGKSTVGRQLAEKLGFIYLDTGALYRAVAYRLLQAGYPNSERNLADVSAGAHIALKNYSGQLRVFVGVEDVTEKIRTEEIGNLASRVSAEPTVRDALLSLQRNVAVDGGVVAEGRDMGTVVFPKAEVKIFLDASVHKRAIRRHRELIERGVVIGIHEVERDLMIRDRQDRERAVAPLRVPHDAVVIDTTDKTIPQVVDLILAVIKGGWQHLPG